MTILFRSAYSMLFAALLVPAAFAVPLGTGFTYQGQLNQNGTPYNGNANLRFSLWDAVTAGSQIGSSEIRADIPVLNGLFTVVLNGSGAFGANAFAGEARWLQIEVCSDEFCSGSPTLLSPRQAVTATPYSQFSLFSAGPWQLNGSNVFYTNGKVGIGLTTPHTMLDVKSGFGTEVMRFALDDGDFHSVSTGFHGAQPYLNYLGFNLERVSNDTRRVMTLQGDGHVGIGTATPSQALQVIGNIFLGPNGEYSAPAAEETVRLMRGEVNSNGFPAVGCCYSVTHASTGNYNVSFTIPFSDTPTVWVQADTPGGGAFYRAAAFVGGGFNFSVQIYDGTSINPVNDGFVFLVMGPR